jgi:hypothetical protein
MNEAKINAAADILEMRAAMHTRLPKWVIRDRSVQYRWRSMSVVTPIATLLFGAAN